MDASKPDGRPPIHRLDDSEHHRMTAQILFPVGRRLRWRAGIFDTEEAEQVPINDWDNGGVDVSRIVAKDRAQDKLIFFFYFLHVVYLRTSFVNLVSMSVQCKLS